MKTPILKKEIVKIFQKYGLSKDHSSISADALINAELVGAYGHGLSRLKMYCDRISKKVINPRAKIKVKKISQSIAHVDGNNSIGFVENVAKKYFQYEVIWITIFIMGMLGLLFDITLRKIIDRTIPWRGKG